jgi:hypothetical protein
MCIHSIINWFNNDFLKLFEQKESNITTLENLFVNRNINPNHNLHL